MLKSSMPSNAVGPGGTRQGGSQFHIHFEQEAADAVAPLREKREVIST